MIYPPHRITTGGCIKAPIDKSIKLILPTFMIRLVLLATLPKYTIGFANYLDYLLCTPIV